VSDRQKAIIIGAVVGSSVGAILAWIASSGYDEEDPDGNPVRSLGPGDYLALGIGVLTLARQFGGMLKRS
jgi:hypothetical protein